MSAGWGTRRRKLVVKGGAVGSSWLRARLALMNPGWAEINGKDARRWAGVEDEREIPSGALLKELQFGERKGRRCGGARKPLEGRPVERSPIGVPPT
eukprot:ctg_1948.g550